jgi:DNA-binding NtrC family response regulator
VPGLEREALIVEADAVVADDLRRQLETVGYEVTVTASPEEAMRSLEARSYALFVMSTATALANRAALADFTHRKAPRTLISLASTDASGEPSLPALRLDEGRIEAEVRPEAPEIPFLVGQSRAMRRIASLIRQVAPTDSTVLITGESGAGKEVVARAVHQLSPLRRDVFLPVNCGAIPESLLDAQLFGHIKGSFTGADDTRQGFFHRANGGTLLLDEIGELAPHLQVKLLRVIEEKEIIPIGATVPVPVKVRVIAGTNRDLRNAVNEGRFREDLYYRLNVVRIEVPPLRERTDDIPLLAQHMIERVNARLGRDYKGVTSACLEVLMSHAWKGNVRELAHAIEYAMIVGDGEWIRPADLPPDIGPSSALALPEAETLDQALRRFEKAFLENELRQLAGNRRDLATKLGIDPSTLYRKIQAFGIKTAD